jgi:hypothetical protein
MNGSKWRLERVVWCFLLSAVACLASGAALAQCIPTLPITAGSVPCYVKVQPIDVGTIPSGSTTPVFAPFNTTSQTGIPSTAGMPFSTSNLLGISLPNNPTSANPIGFVVDPITGLSPGETGYPTTGGLDVTRELLNSIGVDLVWFPMTKYVYNAAHPSVSGCPTGDTLCGQANQDFTTINVKVTLPSNTAAVASCSGFISGTTLTINPGCTIPGNPTTGTPLYDFLSWSGSPVDSNGNPTTFITALGTGTGGAAGTAGTYTVNISQTAGSSKKPLSISVFPGTIGSQDLLNLADQNPSANPPTLPCSISQMTIPPTPPPQGCGGPSPTPPLSSDPGTINLAFVDKLNPPTSADTLYGFSLLCNNGVAIGGSTFFAPSPLQARPDTIAHELLHDFCLRHVNYGAGPWTSSTTGVPPIPGSGLPGITCDSTYPACAANLMTEGRYRTEPYLFLNSSSLVVNCVLSGLLLNGAVVTTPGCSGQASLFNGTADQVAVQVSNGSSLEPAFASSLSPAPQPATTAQLPVPQQAEVLNGGSGLLSCVTGSSPNCIQLTGLTSPIPYETTKAQLETRGNSSDRVIFDLSGPVDGKPGETLVAWVLSLPEGQTFAGQRGFDITSQSRKDLVEDVKYFPGAGDNPLLRKAAYDPGADNNPEYPGIGATSSSQCAATTTACLIVKFLAPGLGADDSIVFSQSILSGGAPITQDELCKAKITYMFSDGYMTTSNFGRCPPASRALVASSWRPDPFVAPHFIKSNMLLAAAPIIRPCTVDTTGDNAGLCKDPSKTPPEDQDMVAPLDGGQLSQSCDNGATYSNKVSGTIKGPNVIISGGQTCNYTDCEFLGSLTINGANATLTSCQVDGNLTINAGTLTLAPPDPPNHPQPVLVIGNVEIGTTQARLSNVFSIAAANINGNVAVQNLPANEPSFLPSNASGLVCGSTVSGAVTVNNSASLIQIGESGQQTNCAVNTIAGGFSCKNSTVTGGLSNGSSLQCK